MASVSHIPRGRATQRLASFAVYGTVPVAGLGVWWLRDTGLIAPTPLWLAGTLLVCGATANLSTSVWVRARPDNAVAVHARVAATALVTAAVLYSVGWGSLLLVAYAIGSAELLRTIGPSSARPNLLWNCVAIALGELAVELGIAPTVVDRPLAHAIAVSGAIMLAVVTKVLGDSARAIEHAEDAVRSRAEHFEALIEHAADLIGVLSVDGTIVSVSPAAIAMLGHRPDEVAGRPIADYVDGPTAEQIDATLRATAAAVGTASSFELTLRHADGSTRLVEATLTTPSDDWDGHIVLNVHDITRQRDLESQLRHDARHDALTGLLNRKAFGEISERACRRAAGTDRIVGMLYIDLDGFKQVNDTFGHDAGDRVLIEAAARLDDCLGPTETLARLGGDEFAVLIHDVVGECSVELAERILTALGAPIAGLPDDVRVGASIGIALRSTEGIEFSTLMQDADAAMYAAKRTGRARWVMTPPVVEL